MVDPLAPNDLRVTRAHLFVGGWIKEQLGSEPRVDVDLSGHERGMKTADCDCCEPDLQWKGATPPDLVREGASLPDLHGLPHCLDAFAWSKGGVGFGNRHRVGVGRGASIRFRRFHPRSILLGRN